MDFKGGWGGGGRRLLPPHDRVAGSQKCPNFWSSSAVCAYSAQPERNLNIGARVWFWGRGHKGELPAPHALVSGLETECPPFGPSNTNASLAPAPTFSPPENEGAGVFTSLPRSPSAPP